MTIAYYCSQHCLRTEHVQRSCRGPHGPPGAACQFLWRPWHSHAELVLYQDFSFDSSNSLDFLILLLGVILILSHVWYCMTLYWFCWSRADQRLFRDCNLWLHSTHTELHEQCYRLALSQRAPYWCVGTASLLQAFRCLLLFQPWFSHRGHFSWSFWSGLGIQSISLATTSVTARSWDMVGPLDDADIQRSKVGLKTCFIKNWIPNLPIYWGCIMVVSQHQSSWISIQPLLEPFFQFSDPPRTTAVHRLPKTRSQRMSDRVETTWRLERNEVDDVLGLRVGRCHANAC